MIDNVPPWLALTLSALFTLIYIAQVIHQRPKEPTHHD